MMDKRKSARKASLERCSVELYTSDKGPFPSRVVNYSDRGLMIEMDRPLTQGEPVKILFRPGAENAQRLGVKTPCAVNGDRCYDCKSPQRICRGLVVLWEAIRSCETEVVLVDEPLGY